VKIKLSECVDDADKFGAWLEQKEACGTAIHWAKGRTLRRAWAELYSPDWMMWLIAVSDADLRRQCNRLALRWAQSPLRIEDRRDPQAIWLDYKAESIVARGLPECYAEANQAAAVSRDAARSLGAALSIVTSIWAAHANDIRLEITVGMLVGGVK